MRRNVPAPNRLRRAEPAPTCPNAELVAPSWRRRVVHFELPDRNRITGMCLNKYAVKKATQGLAEGKEKW